MSAAFGQPAMDCIARGTIYVLPYFEIEMRYDNTLHNKSSTIDAHAWLCKSKQDAYVHGINEHLGM